MKKRLLSAVTLALAIAAAQAFAQSPFDPAKTNVTFAGPGNVTLKGYLARPSGDGPFPGVLLIHEWWGLNRDIQLLADALAARGYLVLAADAYRGQSAATAEEAAKLMQGTPADQVRADLDAALAYLRGRPTVDRDRVVSWGFCFGGTQSMYLGTRRPELAAGVIFYGSGPITSAANLGALSAGKPVLGIYGADDANIPVDQVKAFEKALAEKGAARTITIYPGVGHAFVKSDTYNKTGPAKQAWEQAVAFLDKTLKKPAAGSYGGFRFPAVGRASSSQFGLEIRYLIASSTVKRGHEVHEENEAHEE